MKIGNFHVVRPGVVKRKEHIPDENRKFSWNLSNNLPNSGGIHLKSTQRC